MSIKIYTVGGTIDKIYFDAKSDYQIGAPLVDTILKEGKAQFQYEITPLLYKDSLDMTQEDRDLIVAHVKADPAEKILITHGTDTMILTAQALSVITGKVIVLTGAISPALFKISDAPFNVGCAIGALQSLPHGTYIAINGEIFNPFGVKKDVTNEKFVEVPLRSNSAQNA